MFWIERSVDQTKCIIIGVNQRGLVETHAGVAHPAIVLVGD